MHGIEYDSVCIICHSLAIVHSSFNLPHLVNLYCPHDDNVILPSKKLVSESILLIDSSQWPSGLV